MLCLGCGKEIPFVGDVCPYCQRGKAKSQNYYVSGFLLGIIFCFIGAVSFGVGGGIGGFILGVVVAAFTSGVHKGTKPPVVKIIEKITPDKKETSAEQQLLKLKELFEKGLIQESEYSKKKQEVLSKL